MKLGTQKLSVPRDFADLTNQLNRILGNITEVVDTAPTAAATPATVTRTAPLPTPPFPTNVGGSASSNTSSGTAPSATTFQRVFMPISTSATPSFLPTNTNIAFYGFANTGTNQIVALPPAVGSQILIFAKKEDASAQSVVLDGGGATIDGGANIALGTQFAAVLIIDQAAGQWAIISFYAGTAPVTPVSPPVTPEPPLAILQGFRIRPPFGM